MATHVCPSCKSDAHLRQWGWVAASWGGTFADDGSWNDDGNGASVEWDAVKLDGFCCSNPQCAVRGVLFATPEVR